MSAGTLVIALASGGELQVAAAGIVVVHDGLIDRHTAIEGSVLGSVLRSHRPERLSDLSRRAGQPLTGDLDAQMGLMVPLLHRGRAVGALAAFDRVQGGPEFSSEDDRLMLAFAATWSRPSRAQGNYGAPARRRPEVDAPRRR